MSMPSILRLIAASSVATMFIGCAAEEEALDRLPVDQAATPELTLSVPVEVAPGDTITFTADGTLGEGEVVWFALSTQGAGAGPCPSVFGGQCLGITAPRVLGSVATDALGQASFDFQIPVTAPLGATPVVQALVARGINGSSSLVSGVGSFAVGVCSDSDGDGVCDDDDLCPNIADDVLVGSGTMLPGCTLNVLLVTGSLSPNVDAELTAMGLTVSVVAGAAMMPGYDLSGIDVVALGYNSVVADLAWLEGENAAGVVGLVVHRGDDAMAALDFGTHASWQEGDFSIDDNTHFITQGFALGPMDLGFTYSSDVRNVTPNVDVLGSVVGPSLVVHHNYRRVVTPYYGHTAEMPWTTDAADLTLASYVWAAGVGAQ
jgi:hypothetical protein